jgi:hypothetical protein
MQLAQLQHQTSAPSQSTPAPTATTTPTPTSTPSSESAPSSHEDTVAQLQQMQLHQLEHQ